MRSRFMWLLAVGICAWSMLAVLLVVRPLSYGLLGEYFPGPAFDTAPAFRALDTDFSPARMLRHYRGMPPPAFAVRWAGFLHVPRGGSYTFTLSSGDESRLYIDNQVVVDNRPPTSADRVRDSDGQLLPSAATGSVRMTEGPHAVVLDMVQRGGRLAFRWSWARDGNPPTSIPGWYLSTTRRSIAAAVVPWLRGAWWVITALSIVMAGTAAFRTVRRRPVSSGLIWRLIASAAVILGATWLYTAGATEHARVVNTSKARADQSGYLLDAQEVYANFSGRTPEKLIGVRMRMPIYAGLLALIYDPGQRNLEFFERAKTFNVWLSVGLLAVLGTIFFSLLPALTATTLTLAIAYGYFIQRAGYAQPELLFYTLFLGTFLTCCRLFSTRGDWRSVGLGVLAGTLAGLAYLTKALTPPFVALFVGVNAVDAVVHFLTARRSGADVSRNDGRRALLWRLCASAAVGLAFLAVIAPYIINSKREFGSYFFNANTTYYLWYDTGAEARSRLIPLTDSDGHVNALPETLPNMASYLRSHRAAQIIGRVTDGLREIAVDSYRWYLFPRYLALQVVILVLLVVSNRLAFFRLIHERAALLSFLLLYAAIYLPSTAFFVPTSGTGGVRFFLAHVAPLMFVLSGLVARRPFSETRWNLPGITVTAVHLQLVLLGTIVFDAAFVLWPHLMTSYGGF